MIERRNIKIRKKEESTQQINRQKFVVSQQDYNRACYFFDNVHEKLKSSGGTIPNNAYGMYLKQEYRELDGNAVQKVIQEHSEWKYLIEEIARF